MKRTLKLTMAALLVALAASCAPSKFKTYNGPPVTQIVVEKGDRQMFLLSGRKVLKAYDIGLGFQPIGHKQFEGDGRTPEGIFRIDRLNPARVQRAWEVLAATGRGLADQSARSMVCVLPQSSNSSRYT